MHLTRIDLRQAMSNNDEPILQRLGHNVGLARFKFVAIDPRRLFRQNDIVPLFA